MRLLAVAFLASLLASCGSSEPPGVDFARPVTAVYGALATVDGQVDMQGMLKSPIVLRKQEGDDRLVFVLRSDSTDYRGQLVFQFAKLDNGHTRVAVDAILPEIKATIDGETKVLSEDKIEGLIADRLQAIATRMATGKEARAELDQLDEAIAFTALALDPKEVNRALELARNDAALGAALERQAAWSSDDVSDTDKAGAVMDNGFGEEASGEDPGGEEVGGEEPGGEDPGGEEAGAEEPGGEDPGGDGTEGDDGGGGEGTGPDSGD